MELESVLLVLPYSSSKDDGEQVGDEQGVQDLFGEH